MATLSRPSFTGPAIACCLAGIVLTTGCGVNAMSAPRATARPRIANETERAKEKASVKSGTFTGVITCGAKSTKGKPPGWVPKAFCMAPAVAGKTIDDSLIVSKKGGLANAFVYLSRKPKGYNPPEVKGKVQFEIQFCMFRPRVLAVRVGQTIQVTNKDKVAHNTHTNPIVGVSYNRNLTAKTAIKYDSVEPIPVKVNCDIHGWMFAYQLPLDHDLVAITDKEGKFTINNIPAGTHKFRVWHEKAGYLENGLTVVIQPGKTTNKTLKYKAAKFTGLFGPSPNLVTLSTK